MRLSISPYSFSIVKEKKGKLVLRNRRKSMLGGDTFKALGYTNLPIHELVISGAEEAFSEKQIEVTLKKSVVNGVTVKMIIVSRYAKEVISLCSTLT